MAGARRPAARGGARSEADVDRWAQSAAVLHSNGDGLDIAVKDGRIVGVRGTGRRPRQSRPRRPEGSLRLAGQQLPRSPHPAADPRARRARRDRLGHGDGAHRRALAASCAQTPAAGGASASTRAASSSSRSTTRSRVIGKAGLGTPHMDGNTRLCTATAAAALKASFGTDGQPGSYRDVDHCDAIALWGHNVAETQTVLWMRMLDRRRGADPPRMLAVDPRADARGARGRHPSRDPQRHEPGADERAPARDHRARLVRRRVRGRPHDRLRRARARGRGLRRPARGRDLRRPGAADRGGRASCSAPRSACSRRCCRASTSRTRPRPPSCQVNNLHLLRGMIGRPGAGIYQMNGQPTAQNTRETGADGDLSGLRNWENKEHIRELAELWNVDEIVIPHWSPPTHAMQIWRYAEQGSIKLLWISATNPAVSLPELARVRRILAQDDLMVVVQDMFLTETARLADVVLPAAGWGEKLGTFTNVDRTVHISERAVDPPGEARSDLDIFLDYARAHGLPRPRRRAADQVARRRIRVRGLEGLLRRPAVRLHRHDATTACAAAAGSSGRAPPTRRTAPSGSTPTGTSTPTPTTARRSGRTSRRERRSARRRTAPRSRTAAPSCTPPSTSRSPRPRTTSTRCCSRPGARSTTSTRARRPAVRRNSRRRRRTCGSS